MLARSRRASRCAYNEFWEPGRLTVTVTVQLVSGPEAFNRGWINTDGCDHALIVLILTKSACLIGTCFTGSCCCSAAVTYTASANRTRRLADAGGYLQPPAALASGSGHCNLWLYRHLFMPSSGPEWIWVAHDGPRRTWGDLSRPCCAQISRGRRWE